MWRGMNVSFRDMLFLLVFAYLVISAVALAYVSKNKDESKGAAAPGNVIVELTWPPKIDADVDLWVQGPGDVPVGYSDKSGMIFNLLRDDLGHPGDPNSMNYEVAYVSLQDGKGQVQEILQSDVKLAFEGQETTAFRFKLDGKGAFEPGSMNRIHKNLRNAGAKQ